MSGEFPIPDRAGERSPLVVLMPVYDDWEAARLLLAELDRELALVGRVADVIVVDDGSISPRPRGFGASSGSAVRRVEVLRLRRNLGHQRALAVGLCFVHARLPECDVVVMDADGEDRASDVPRLLEAFERTSRTRAVFGRRLRRSEGLVFSAFYRLYRLLHRLLTGLPVEVGNFSVVSPDLLSRLVVASELWNHYAASVVKLRLPRDLLDVSRGDRLAGSSKMSFVSLAVHGLGAMSVFAERIGARLLVGASAASGLLGLAVVGLALAPLFADLDFPPWALVAVGVLVILASQLGMAALIFVFMVLQGRASASFVPARDVAIFVESLEEVGPD